MVVPLWRNCCLCCFCVQAVLRYLIRVFEIKGGSRSNQTLLIGGSFWEGEERVQGGEESPNGAPGPPGPPAQLLASQLATTGADAVASSSSSGLSSTNSPHPPWLAGTPTKAETAERDRGPGLLVHRTRDVRFQCHRCGHFYSWEKSLRLHYERAHHEPLPDNELLYVLPWERKRCVRGDRAAARVSSSPYWSPPVSRPLLCLCLCLSLQGGFFEMPHGFSFCLSVFGCT